MSTYTVFVAENAQYMDDEATWKQGEYPSWEEALAKAQRIVEGSLTEQYQPGMSGATLYGLYITFGDDAYIVPEPDGEHFSAWNYAKQRCEVLCAAGDNTPQEE